MARGLVREEPDGSRNRVQMPAHLEAVEHSMGSTRRRGRLLYEE